MEGKRPWSYEQIHELVHHHIAPRVVEFCPDVIVAIGGGGFIPARMLRTVFKRNILAVSLELYDDASNTPHAAPIKKQWLSDRERAQLHGARVLVVDEVDDTRTTLAFCVEELRKEVSPSALAVAVVHNKKKEKRGRLPDDVEYIAGVDIDDIWCVYPWDSMDIRAHTVAAAEFDTPLEARIAEAASSNASDRSMADR